VVLILTLAVKKAHLVDQEAAEEDGQVMVVVQGINQVNLEIHSGVGGTGPDLGPPGTTGYGGGAGGAGAGGSAITGGAAYNVTAFPSSYGQGGYYAGGGGGGYQPGTSGNGGGGTATTAGGAGGANTQSEGLANTGGGGAGNDATTPQGQGGSGVVLVKELDVTQNVSGRWSMNDILEAVKAGNWTN